MPPPRRLTECRVLRRASPRAAEAFWRSASRRRVLEDDSGVHDAQTSTPRRAGPRAAAGPGHSRRLTLADVADEQGKVADGQRPGAQALGREQEHHAGAEIDGVDVEPVQCAGVPIIGAGRELARRDARKQEEREG